jgi:hypothetical protein
MLLACGGSPRQQTLLVQPPAVGVVRAEPDAQATCLVQVKRWARQYHLSVQAGAQPLGEMLALIDWLQDHIPPKDEDPAASRLSHGDFRCSLLLGRLRTVAALHLCQRRQSTLTLSFNMQQSGAGCIVVPGFCEPSLVQR